MRRFLQKHRDKTAAALSILTVVLVLAFFVFGLRPVEPRNPIGGYTPLEPEVMAVSSGGDDTDESATCGSGSSTESDIQEDTRTIRGMRFILVQAPCCRLSLSFDVAV